MAKTYTPPTALEIVEEVLRKKKKETEQKKFTYSVPSLWLVDECLEGPCTPKREKVQPFEFFLDAVQQAQRAKRPPKPTPTGGEWSREAVIYNMFVRTTAAFDHNGNGTLDLPVNADGFRETGTFMKALAMLPYIKRLGANTVHLL
ncbi:MAG TPA: hypothetical protein VNL69_05790, partial [Bacteroidota bacterium]|nr:hypothetical protein [Bacteroidota bacterium]